MEIAHRHGGGVVMFFMENNGFPFCLMKGEPGPLSRGRQTLLPCGVDLKTSRSVIPFEESSISSPDFVIAPTENSEPSGTTLKHPAPAESNTVLPNIIPPSLKQASIPNSISAMPSVDVLVEQPHLEALRTPIPEKTKVTSTRFFTAKEVSSTSIRRSARIAAMSPAAGTSQEELGPKALDFGTGAGPQEPATQPETTKNYPWLGIRVEDVDEDGNCAILAILRSMGVPQTNLLEQVHNSRVSVANFVLQNREGPFMTGGDVCLGQKVIDNHCAHYSENGNQLGTTLEEIMEVFLYGFESGRVYWLDSLLIGIFCNILRINLSVFVFKDGLILKENQVEVPMASLVLESHFRAESARKFSVFFVKNNHFMAVFPIKLPIPKRKKQRAQTEVKPVTTTTLTQGGDTASPKTIQRENAQVPTSTTIQVRHEP